MLGRKGQACSAAVDNREDRCRKTAAPFAAGNVEVHPAAVSAVREMDATREDDPKSARSRAWLPCSRVLLHPAADLMTDGDHKVRGIRTAAEPTILRAFRIENPTLENQDRIPEAPGRTAVLRTARRRVGGPETGTEVPAAIAVRRRLLPTKNDGDSGG